jgi:beta-glucanase (GH16 family)
LKTAGLFDVQYGRIEARIKIPSRQGIWPAFWLLGSDFVTNSSWPQCGEIDVMENVCREPSIIHGTVHGLGYSGAHGISSPAGLPNARKFAHDFYIYEVQWSADRIEFFVDRKLYLRVTQASLPAGAPWVFDYPFFILLNVAVGGDRPGNPDRNTYFPQLMQVDWVRVWKAGPIQKQSR